MLSFLNKTFLLSSCEIDLIAINAFLGKTNATGRKAVIDNWGWE
jgi:hypothetical protein